jgi:hypothetical protein
VARARRLVRPRGGREDSHNKNSCRACTSCYISTRTPGRPCATSTHR